MYLIKFQTLTINTQSTLQVSIYITHQSYLEYMDLLFQLAMELSKRLGLRLEASVLSSIIQARKKYWRDFMVLTILKFNHQVSSHSIWDVHIEMLKVTLQIQVWIQQLTHKNRLEIQQLWETQTIANKILKKGVKLLQKKPKIVLHLQMWIGIMKQSISVLKFL